jgi:tRNA(Phe) wybutosine-synthesizing methylase Tyw3
MKVEKDQMQVLLDKTIKKLEKKTQHILELENNIKTLKDERNQLDD